MTRGWLPQLLASAASIHFLFGTTAVLNTLGLGFFFYYPRLVDIIITESGTDTVFWVASACVFSLLAVWAVPRPWKLPLLFGMLFTFLLGAWVLLDNNGLPVYLLYFIGTLEIALYARRRDRNSGWTLSFISSTFVYTLAAIAIIETSAATHFSILSMQSTTTIGSIDASIELQGSYLSYSLLPFLYLVLLSSWIWAPPIQRRLTALFSSKMKTTELSDPEVQGTVLQRLQSLLQPKILVALAAIVFIGYYPYFQNPPWLVGTDAVYLYYSPLLRMTAKGGFIPGLAQALNERHTIALMILYILQAAFSATPFAVVRLTPLLLVVTLAFGTSWFLAKDKGKGFGLLVVLVSSLSMVTSIGIYSSIIANWMALILCVVFFAIISSRDGGFRVLDAVILFITSTLILLLHPWTWGIFAPTVLIAAFVSMAKDKGRQRLIDAYLIFSVIALDLALALGAILIWKGSLAGGVAEAFYYVSAWDTSIASFASSFWLSLNLLTKVWAPFFSPLYLLISIIGVVFFDIGNPKRWRRRLVLSWLCVTSIASVLMSPVGLGSGQSLLWRVVFLTPIQITAPFGILAVSQLVGRVDREPRNHTGASTEHAIATWLCALIAIGVLLALVPPQLRLVSFITLFSATAVALRRAAGHETTFLSLLLLVLFVTIAFNNVTRALSQLLLDPHNCTRC